MKLQMRRIYDPAHPGDGFRVLVDRLWPRGVKKETAGVDLWLREIAPSDTLRKWFGHHPARWPEFLERYHRELDGNPGPVNTLRDLGKKHPVVTLLFAAKDKEHCNAQALLSFLK